MPPVSMFQWMYLYLIDQDTRDSSYIQTASFDGSIRRWDSITGRCVQVLCFHSLIILKTTFKNNVLCLFYL